MFNKNKTLTPEQMERRNILRARMFWILVGFNILLVVYIIIQIALLMK